MSSISNKIVLHVYFINSTSGEWEYTKQVSREGPDGTTEWEQVQGKVKGDKTFFKTEFKLVEYHGKNMSSKCCEFY